MNNKYYTPEIGEFHVGFEYEHGGSGHEVFYTRQQVTEKTIPDKWWKRKWHFNQRDRFQIDAINLFIECGFIRVKYLDKEDIEDLGFESKNHTEYHYIENKEISLYTFVDRTISIEIRRNGILDKEVVGICIKNKLELKVLLKQLGI